MTDDLRKLVEEDLPRLAYQIMKPVATMPNSAFPRGRHNFVRSADWGRLNAAERLDYAGPDTLDGATGYHYKGRWSHAEGGHLMDQWWIGFYGINLTDITDEAPEPVQVDNSEVKTISIVDYKNNNASIRRIKSNKSETKDTSSEKTFEATAEAEFETSITRSAEASIGPVSGKSEFMAKFRSKISASAGGAWRSSDRIEEQVDEEYDVLPFSHRQLTIKEGQPHIRQKIPTKGLLDCKVRIYIYNANAQTFDSLDHVIRCWSGLRPGHVAYSSWFGGGNAVPQSDIDQWVRPYLNLDIEVEADRVRYFGKEDNGWPIPGHEADYEKAKEAYFASIEKGAR
ncbi:MAG: hypothetical protein OXL41_04005 [Nitrospinae bacterium]|nr:hypothetical protein [Nitrospinota bacterium]